MKKRIFVCIFFVICLVPLLTMPYAETSDSVANEKTIELPALVFENGSVNLNYLNEFSDYFDQSFGLRNQMISLHNKIVGAVFSESAEEKVILGKDGWLFYKETLDDYQKTNQMSARDIYSVSRTLYLMQEYCQARGMDFFFTIAPNKNSLYGEKMPWYYREGEKSSNAQLLTEAMSKAGVNYIDLFQEFSLKEETLYRKTDSHWTHQGAGLAADCILRKTGKEFTPYFGGETSKTASQTGDLFEMLYPAEKDDEKETAYKRAFSFIYERPVRSFEDNFIRCENMSEEGTLFMFRDSFGNTLHSYMAEAFSKSVFCRLMPYNLTLAENEAADTVVVEIVERNLEWLITKGVIFASPERERVTGENLTKEAQISVLKECELEGFTKIEGTISLEKLAADDHIYLLLGEKTYEAFPGENGRFYAYIPSTEMSEDVVVMTAKK